MQINKILVSTELDTLSEVVLDFALQLAHQLRVKEIILLKLIDSHPNTLGLSSESLRETTHGNNQTSFRTIKKQITLTKKQARRNSDEEVYVKPVVQKDDGVTSMNEYMHKLEADLLMCGGEKQTALLDVLKYTPAKNVIYNIYYPMIVVTDKASSSGIENIALALDVTEENQNGIESIIDLARELDAQLQLVHIITNNTLNANDAIDRLQYIAKKNKIQNYSINVLNNQSLEDGLQRFVEKYSPDMIAVISQGKGKLEKLIFGSNTEDIIEELKIPVFVCHCD